MIRVVFHGDLQRFGRRFDLHAATPAEALRALFLQIDGLREYVADRYYQVRAGGHDCSEADIKDVLAEGCHKTVHVVPRVAGAGKNGGLQIVIGIVLIAASWYMGGAAGWAYLSAAGYGMATMAFMMGTSMILGGVSQMLTKTPSFDSSSSGTDANQSSSFSNLGNTSAQGRPIPVAAGLVYTGSRLISQGVETYRVNLSNKEEAADPAMTVFRSTKIKKTYVANPEAATAPNGELYKTDFNNDSVKARNYIATIVEG